MNVLLVDDHPVVRQGLRSFLESFGMRVVGEASSGWEALNMASRLSPDVVLVDLVMPDMDGIELIETMKDEGVPAHVVVVTGFDDDSRVLKALEVGVKGYVLKDAEPFELLNAIRAAMNGEVYLHPSVAGRVASLLLSSKRGSPQRAVDELTERELQILRLIAQGLRNKEIAARLSLSEATVKSHVSSILAKLGLDDRVQAALWAVRHGLAAEPDRPSSTH